MIQTEGVIQYQLQHRTGELPEQADYSGLFDWFRRCRQRNLLGQDPHRYAGYAYGNISVRSTEGFVISGTQTGGKSSLEKKDLAWVRVFDSQANCLTSQGPAKPSSEAMSHGEVYQAASRINAVIHVHSPEIWRNAPVLGLPVTDPAAGYGTPAMAAEVRRILHAAPTAGVLAMGGHEDGIIAYAATMDAAGQLLLDALDAAEAGAGNRQQ
jgi:hypothetical protein